MAKLREQDRYAQAVMRGEITLRQVPQQYKSYVEAETSKFRQDWTRKQNKAAAQVAKAGIAVAGLPSMISAAVAAPVAFMGGMAGSMIGGAGVDAIVKKASDGKYNNWGEGLQAWTNASPDGDTEIAQMTNPGYIIGGVVGGWGGQKIQNNLTPKPTTAVATRSSNRTSTQQPQVKTILTDKDNTVIQVNNKPVRKGTPQQTPKGLEHVQDVDFTPMGSTTDTPSPTPSPVRPRPVTPSPGGSGAAVSTDAVSSGVTDAVVPKQVPLPEVSAPIPRVLAQTQDRLLSTPELARPVRPQVNLGTVEPIKMPLDPNTVREAFFDELVNNSKTGLTRADITARLNEPIPSSFGTTTLQDHINGVVHSAKEFPVPKGYTRNQFELAAALHDLGKIVTGQEANNTLTQHGAVVTDILRGSKNPLLANVASDKDLMFALENHMPGKESIYTSGNNLAKALVAADVTRGRVPYDEAAREMPYLFTWDKEVPALNVKAGNREALQFWNEAHGYPYDPSWTDEQLVSAANNTMARHRSFFRGVRQPFGFDMVNPNPGDQGIIEATAQYFNKPVSNVSQGDVLAYFGGAFSKVQGRSMGQMGGWFDRPPSSTHQQGYFMRSGEGDRVVYMTPSINKATGYGTSVAIHQQDPGYAETYLGTLPFDPWDPKAESLGAFIDRTSPTLFKNPIDIKPTRGWL